MCIAAIASAEITYDFTGKGGTFDGTNAVDIALTDSSINFTMTVLGSGGDLNSNSGDLGVGDDQIDGTAESISISFDVDIDFAWIEFGGVGSDTTDGVTLTVGSQSPVELYTGVSDFNGSSDTYTPSSVIRVTSEESILITGSSATSSFDLEKMTFAAVPEPATMSLIGLAGLLTIATRRFRLRG